MKIENLEIPDVKLITLDTFHDSRGFFVERFNEKKFSNLGVNLTWVQDNFSNSIPGVIRGLHYQFELPQTKLVSCTSGEIYDVAVDIRKGSKTYGQHVGVTLSASIPQCLLVPAGFAHGFCVTSKTPADVSYKVNALYSADGEGGIRWDDSQLAIKWPVSSFIVSNKDLELQSFNQYDQNPKFSV